MRKNWPKITTWINIQVHNQFLMKLTPQETARYCLQRIIKPMLVLPPPKKKLEKRKGLVLQELQDLVFTSWTFAFGCALCHTFFRWLVADEMKFNSKSYWSIPDHYLNADFEPGLIEQFLAMKWKGELVKLLGVDEAKVPWLTQLLKSNIDEKLFSKEIKWGSSLPCNLVYIQKTSEFMREIRNGRKKAIQDVDEAPRKKRYNSVISRIPVYTGRKPEKWLVKPVSEKCAADLNVVNKRQCPVCRKIENDDNEKFKRCKKCVDEKWPQPRYYCSVNCQTSHWYKVHHDEHSKQKIK